MESWKTRKFLRSTLFISLSLFLVGLKATANHHVNQSVEVESLGQGACWVENTYPAKVASFNQGLTFFIEEHMVTQALGQLERAANSYHFDLSSRVLEDSSYHLHCSGQGVHLVINAQLEDQKTSLCSWFAVDERGPALAQWGISEGSGFCHGFSVGELVVGVRPGESLSEQMERLYQHEGWAQRIESYEQLSEQVGILYLSRNWWGSELDSVSQLQQLKIFRFVEVENNYRPIGDSLDLFTQ